jgi:hypothetical protein
VSTFKGSSTESKGSLAESLFKGSPTESLFKVSLTEMTEVLSTELPLDINALEQSILGMDCEDSRFGKLLCSRLGYTQVTAGRWEGSEAMGLSREVSLVVKCPPKPMLPDSTRVQIRHRLQRRDGSTLLLEREVATLDIPYGESFRVQERWVAVAAHPGVARANQGSGSEPSASDVPPAVQLRVLTHVWFKGRVALMAGKIRHHSTKKSRKVAALACELLMQADFEEAAAAAHGLFGAGASVPPPLPAACGEAAVSAAAGAVEGGGPADGADGWGGGNGGPWGGDGNGASGGAGDGYRGDDGGGGGPWGDGKGALGVGGDGYRGGGDGYRGGAVPWGDGKGASSEAALVELRERYDALFEEASFFKRRCAQLERENARLEAAGRHTNKGRTELVDSVRALSCGCGGWGGRRRKGGSVCRHALACSVA